MLFDNPPSDWTSTTLGEICNQGGGGIQTGPFGSQLHASDYVSEGTPSIMPANIVGNRISEESIARITQADTDRLSKYLVQTGDIVYSRRGDVKKCALITSKEKGWLCGTGCLRVRPGKGIVDPLFCSYFLSHVETREWISRHAVGATMPNLNTGILSEVPFLLPGESEQKAIAHILGTLDDKIELNQKMNRVLEEITKAIFKSWFVDFDPVHAKAAGHPTSLLPEISNLFPDELMDSEIGEIPEGWSVSTFADLANIQNGYAFKSKDWCEEGQIPVVKIGNVKPMLVDVESCSRVNKETVDGLERFRLSSGDALIGMTGYVGEVGLVPEVAEMSYLNQRVGRLVAHHASDYAFMVTLARREEFKVEVENLGTGSAQANVSAGNIKGIKVVLPCSDLKAKFGDLITPVIDRILISAAEIKCLSDLRDTLLPKLISAELRIPDAEKFLEEAGI